jgi:CubicO group peptidase (beta-lactamase class C family)
MKPLLSLACLCLALLSFSPSSMAQSNSSPSPDFPSTVQGDLGRSLLGALNLADPQGQDQYVSTRFSERAFKSEPAAAWKALLQKLSRQGRPLTVASVNVESPTILSIRVHSADNHWAKLVVFSDRNQPDKIANLVVMPTMSPVDEEKTRLPAKKMTEDQVIKLIDQQIAARAALDRFSGTVLVAKGDRVILTRAVGMAEKSFKIPNAPATRFHLGSMDKMFTGVAIAQLVQQGRLAFDDTLAKVLPDFPDRAMAEKITIHQLLTHTAGTGDFIAHPEYRKNRDQYHQLADHIPLIANQPLYFVPGARFGYSNSGYVLLGLVIEKVSGESYYDYVANHVFRPAGMIDTGYPELNAVAPNRATGYLRDADEDPMGIGPYRSNIFFLGIKGNSAGGGYSTIKDLFAFAQAIRTNKLLNKELTQTVLAGKVRMAGAAQPGDYGYGFTTRTVGGKQVRGMTGGGANSGVNSSIEMFDDGSYTVIVLGNYDAPAAQDLNNAICEFLALQ